MSFHTIAEFSTNENHVLAKTTRHPRPEMRTFQGF